jgi:hypothetical protein
MEIERDNWRAMLVNGATRTSGVNIAAHAASIDLLRTIKFYYLHRTKRRVSVRCVRANLAGNEIYLT